MKKAILKFYNSSEKKSYSVTINDVEENLTQEKLQTAMTSMIGVFVPAGSEIDEASIVDTVSTEVFNLID
ncbi:MAG TPA: DUF2922 domain-containing protein [Tepiditoga sp.]|nr:DUF2922 domain-containing protein [Tepiditoga sp.]